MIIDKVYVITIDKSQSNIRRIINNVKDVGLPNKAPIQIIGVNGWELTDKHLDDMGVGVYKNWNLNYSDATNKTKWHNRDITKGEIGCALSHIEVWEDAYKNRHKNIIVYEDDFNKLRDLDWSILNNVDFDLLYLGRNLQVSKIDNWDEYYNEELCIPGFSYQSHAYLLSENGIKILVEHYLPRFKSKLIPLDDFLALTYGPIYRKDLDGIYSNKHIFALAFNRNIVYQNRIKKSSTEPRENPKFEGFIKVKEQ